MTRHEAVVPTGSPAATLAAAALLAAGVAAAQQEPIELTNTQSLGFGTLVPGSGGTVTVNALDGTRTCSAGITCLSSGSGQAARFEITGDSGASYSISPISSIELTNGDGDSMTVDSFDTSLGDGSGTLDASGNDSFTVGATLEVGSGQATGSYSGSFEVTVEYQ